MQTLFLIKHYIKFSENEKGAMKKRKQKIIKNKNGKKSKKDLIFFSRAIII